MKRHEHTFRFSTKEIRDAAADEAEYHEARRDHWANRAEAALVIVKETIGARVVERPVTGGVQIDVVVDYGDGDAWREYNLAVEKARTHGRAAEEFRIDEQTYGSQVTDSVLPVAFDLDVEDVRHFRLGGEPRED